jgi:DNA (cytosine-5)-methyltransferase 1
MNFATLCSGIGAPEVAAHRLGMEPVFCSEIEPFPCAVLAHHWPDVPNYGDMTAWRDWPHHDLDLLIAGTPCQAFSVAGLRQGLDDARGNLTLEFARYADAIRPRFVLWENVPGVLSDKSNAFWCLLGGLAGTDTPLLPRGGRWANAGFVSGPRRQIAWRVLDAQHFGVAQRRRRVWLLAGDVERGAGGWACARALFPEQCGVRGDIAQGGEAREEVAGTLGGGSGSRGWCDDLDRCGAFVTHTLRGEGFDASEDGTGRGTPLVAVPINTHHVAKMVHWQQGGGEVEDNVSGALRANAEHSYQFARIQSTVRRLTPRECERLQGFPDDHTAVQYRNKPACDGPRYKALGNSMAVPCVEWILGNLLLTASSSRRP